MFPSLAYLDFAGRWYGQVSFDLATSGIAPVAPAALGGPIRLDDYSSRERFRAAVAARFSVPVAEVVPTLGASGALFVAHATWLSPGDRLLVEAPSYEPLWRGAEALGHPVDRFTRRFEAGLEVDVDAVLKALRPETKMVAITNPHNPSGVVTSEDALRELAASLSKRNVVLLIDEAYLELHRPRSTARALGSNVVCCNSATKCWGAGWTRAGWLIGPADRAADAARIERYVAGLAPPAAWALGERAVAVADDLLARAHGLQEGKRTRIDRFLTASAGTLSWVAPPAAGVFGWVRDARGQDLLSRIERGIAELGVIVAPGTFFGEPSAFRLGFTSDAAKLDEALDRLARALELPSATSTTARGEGGAS